MFKWIFEGKFLLKLMWLSTIKIFKFVYLSGIASAHIDPSWLVEKSDVHELKNSLPKSLLTANLSDFTVWVDPLDATKEYTEGFLDHVTVLIGIALGKKAIAGVIHQPFYG